METNHTHSPIWIKRGLIKCSECGETLPKEPRDIGLIPMFIDGQKNDKCVLWSSPKHTLKSYIQNYHPDYYSTLLSVLGEYETYPHLARIPTKANPGRSKFCSRKIQTRTTSEGKGVSQ